MDHPKHQGYPVHIGHMGDPGQENLKSPGRWGGQLEEMLSLAHEHAVTVHSNVSSPQAPRLETGPASTSGSTSGSGYTTSAETVHYYPHSRDDPSTTSSIDSSTVCRSRTIPEQSISGISLRTTTTPERTTDARTLTTTQPHTRNVQDVMQTQHGSPRHISGRSMCLGIVLPENLPKNRVDACQTGPRQQWQSAEEQPMTHGAEFSHIGMQRTLQGERVMRRRQLRLLSYNKDNSC
jgi:hypothetical protein